MKAAKGSDSYSPRINNRRALHEYSIESKLECGIALVGSEVKALREGKAQLADAYARVEHGQLILHGCHIDPYEKATTIGHVPLRSRILLVHKREIRKLESITDKQSLTLIPLAIYFKDGRAKVELAVARGKQRHDKRDAIRRREQDRDLRRSMMRRR